MIKSSDRGRKHEKRHARHRRRQRRQTEVCTTSLVETLSASTIGIFPEEATESVEEVPLVQWTATVGRDDAAADDAAADADTAAPAAPAAPVAAPIPAPVVVVPGSLELEMTALCGIGAGHESVVGRTRATVGPITRPKRFSTLIQEKHSKKRK